VWNRNGGWNKLNAKKWVTIVTLICTIIAVVLMTVFKCCFSDGNIGYDIALAIFGSALLGLIMSLVEYFSERKKAMEQFWIEAKRVLAQFRKAKYIYFDEPEEIVIGCIAENYYILCIAGLFCIFSGEFCLSFFWQKSRRKSRNLVI